MTMAADKKKTLMRNIGEFFGHIAKAVRADPDRQEIQRSSEEARDGNVILRRTTIDEIEIKDNNGGD